MTFQVRTLWGALAAKREKLSLTSLTAPDQKYTE